MCLNKVVTNGHNYTYTISKKWKTNIPVSMLFHVFMQSDLQIIFSENKIKNKRIMQ